MRALRLAVVLASLLVAASTEVSRAGQIVYDGIQYAAGALNGDIPPATSGLVGPWMADPGVAVVPAGLSSFLDKPSAGGAVSGFFNFQIPMMNALAPLPGTEFWASFLLFHSGPNDQTYMGLSPAGAPFGNPPSVGFGVRLGQYGIFVGGAFTPCAVPFTPAGSTDFLVTHFVASGATWVVQLFVNKGTFLVPDLVMNVAPVTYQTMVNLNESEFGSDEFRIGNLSSDVAAGGATPTKPTTWGRLKQLYN